MQGSSPVMPFFSASEDNNFSTLLYRALHLVFLILGLHSFRNKKIVARGFFLSRGAEQNGIKIHSQGRQNKRDR